MRLLSLGALAFALSGCQPSIGSSCVQSTDCSPTGTLLCDTSQPGGYCTIFNCRPDSCPNNSGCIATNISALGCPYDDRHAPSRFSRQLCLQLCNQDSDCRTGSGYGCIDPTTYGLQVLDNQPNLKVVVGADGGTTTTGGEKVCLPKTSYVVPGDATMGTAPVCSVTGPPEPPFEAGPGYQGGDAGVDAGSDADAGAPDASDAALD